MCVNPEIAIVLLSPSGKRNLESSATVGDGGKKKWNWILDDIPKPLNQTDADNYFISVFFKIPKPIQHFYCLRQPSRMFYFVHLNE